jgi:hypothetical protein
MNTTTDEIVRALSVGGRPRPPRVITQHQFDGNDEALRRLADPRIEPSDADLVEYALDLSYVELQPDLFAWVFPRMMERWRRCVLSDTMHHWIEQFYGAIAIRPAVLGFGGKKRRHVVHHYMADVVIERIDRTDRLLHDGSSDPYDLFHHLSVLGIVNPEYPRLWEAWWDLSTIGRCRVAMQWASSLMFFEEDNPVFPPRSSYGGGGAPIPWDHCGSIYDRGWSDANASFVERRLTVEYLRDRLQQAADRLRSEHDGALAGAVWAALDECEPLLASRIGELPALLRGYGHDRAWTV